MGGGAMCENAVYREPRVQKRVLFQDITHSTRVRGSRHRSRAFSGSSPRLPDVCLCFVSTGILDRLNRRPLVFNTDIVSESANDNSGEIASSLSCTLESVPDVRVFFNQFPRDVSDLLLGKRSVVFLTKVSGSEHGRFLQSIDEDFMFKVPLESILSCTSASQGGIHVLDFDDSGSYVEAYEERLRDGRLSERSFAAFFSCSRSQANALRHDFPDDFFSECLRSPASVLLRFHSTQYESLGERSIGLRDPIDSELLSQVTSILENTLEPALSAVLPVDSFLTLLREDSVLRRCVVGFVVARRILRDCDVEPVSLPSIPELSDESVWDLLWLELDSALFSFNRGTTIDMGEIREMGLRTLETVVSSKSDYRSLLGVIESTLPDSLPLLLSILRRDGGPEDVCKFNPLGGLSRLIDGGLLNGDVLRAISVILWTSPRSSSLLTTSSVMAILSLPPSVDSLLCRLLLSVSSASHLSLVASLGISLLTDACVSVSGVLSVLQLGVVWPLLNESDRRSAIECAVSQCRGDVLTRLACVFFFKASGRGSSGLFSGDCSAFIREESDSLSAESLFELVVGTFFSPPPPPPRPHLQSRVSLSYVKRLWQSKPISGQASSNVVYTNENSVVFGSEQGCLCVQPIDTNSRLLVSSEGAIFHGLSFINNSSFGVLFCSDRSGIIHEKRLEKTVLSDVGSFEAFSSSSILLDANEFDARLLAYDRDRLDVIDLYEERRLFSVSLGGIRRAESVKQMGDVTLVSGSDIVLYDSRVGFSREIHRLCVPGLHEGCSVESRPELVVACGVSGDAFLYDLRVSREGYASVNRCSESIGESVVSFGCHGMGPVCFIGGDRGSFVVDLGSNVRQSVSGTVWGRLFDRRVGTVPSSVSFHPFKAQLCILSSAGDVSFFGF